MDQRVRSPHLIWKVFSKVKTLVQVFFWYVDIVKHRKLSRSSFLKWQSKQLVRQLQHVQKKSTLYSKFETIQNASQLQQFPVMKKVDYFQQFDQINTSGLKKADLLQFAQQAERDRNFSPKYQGYTVGLSSGSSGSQGLFVVSPEELSRYIISIIDKTVGWQILKPQKIAFFLRANSNLYSQAGSLAFHQFRFFDLMKSIEEQLKQLEELNPSLLFAPPFVLYQIALAVEQKQISIRPKTLFSVADKLEVFHQKKIESVFGLKVRQVYQATEGFLGISCRHGTIHLNEDFVFFEKEMIDENSFYPIITDLFRFTQPMIRYRLDDVLTLSQTQCPCGSHLTTLSSIQGRQDDIVVGLTHDEKRIQILPDFLRRAALLVSHDFQDYQITQVAPEHFELSTNPADPKLQNDITENIKEFFKSRNLKIPQISITPYIKPNPMHKRPRIRCKA